jgi:hypothetical protein
MSEDERAEYNAYSDFLNAEIAAGRDPFDGPPTADAWSRYNAARGKYGLPPTAGRSNTSGDQGPSCPRGDSNTRHAV